MGWRTINSGELVDVREIQQTRGFAVNLMKIEKGT